RRAGAVPGPRPQGPRPHRPGHAAGAAAVLPRAETVLGVRRKRRRVLEPARTTDTQRCPPPIWLMWLVPPLCKTPLAPWHIPPAGCMPPEYIIPTPHGLNARVITAWAWWFQAA